MNSKADIMFLICSLVFYILYKTSYKKEDGNKWTNIRAKGNKMMSILGLVIVIIDVFFKFMSYLGIS